MFTRCLLGRTAPVAPRLRSTSLPVAMSPFRRGFASFDSAEVFTVDGLLISVCLAHRNHADVVFSFGGDDRHERIAKRPQGDEALFTVFEAAILECHGHSRLDHRLRVCKIEPVLLEVACSLCR